LPGIADKFYWVVLNVNNASLKNQKLIIEVSNPVIDSIFFYEVKKDNKIVLLSENGDEIPFYKREIINELPVFAINLNKKEEKTYILMLRKRKNIKFPISLYQKRKFEKKSRIKIFFHSLYFGGILIIAISVFIVSFFTHRRLLRSYALYSLSIGMFLFADTGYAFEFLYPNTTGLSSALRVPLSMLILLSFMFFTSQFLEIKKYKPLLSKIVFGFAISWIAIYLLSLPFLWISPNSYHSFILFIVYLFNGLGLLLLLFSAIVIYKSNKLKVKLYVFAVIILIIGLFIFSATQFGVFKTEIVAMHPFMMASVGELLVFSSAVFYDIRRLAIERNTLLVRNSIQEKELLISQIKGNELASSRISNELHDNIATRLALIKNKLLNNNCDKTDLSKDIKKIYNEVREISHRLSPHLFNLLGCKTSISNFVNEISQNSKLSITSSIFCGEGEHKISDEIAIQLYRIIQEALHNCIKYAGEANVDIYLHKEKINIILRIEDDGNGFNLDTSKLGAGISNLKLRAEMVNGNFNIYSKVGLGTKIEVIVPF